MDTPHTHLTLPQLEAGLRHIRQSPSDQGVLRLIVRRPQVDERELLSTAQLDPRLGLVGDTWVTRPNRHTPDGSPDTANQITLMNARVIALVAQSPERWPLAGDQLFVDFDLSEKNVPAGTRLTIGEAMLEVTSKPHTGCSKFAARFGAEALQFVNSPTGTALHMRGINARVIRAGEIHPGDLIQKVK